MSAQSATGSACAASAVRLAITIMAARIFIGGLLLEQNGGHNDLSVHLRSGSQRIHHPVNTTQITEPEARALADAINQISRTQPPAEALKFVEMALARAPQQPIVLNAAGGHFLQVNNATRA